MISMKWREFTEAQCEGFCAAAIALLTQSDTDGEEVLLPNADGPDISLLVTMRIEDEHKHLEVRWVRTLLRAPKGA